MEEPKPVLVAKLFPEIQQELVNLLKSLPAEDWEKPTACADWSVKDVAIHLLGVEMWNLSSRRDGKLENNSINDWKELVTFINSWNQDWVSVGNRISSSLLIDLLELVGPQMCEYFQSLDPFSIGGAISWVGPEPAPVWLDLAREYTERWHHQQHIRDATGKPGLKQHRFFSPVFETFIRALPRTFLETQAGENESVTVTITGSSGGQWSILRKNLHWDLYTGATGEPSAEVIIDQEIAWRLFTRGLSRELALPQAIIKGDPLLGQKVFDMVSIIA